MRVQAIVGLIGALALGGVAWWNQRYSARSRRRRAARVLLGEAAAFQVRVDQARAERVPLAGVGHEMALLLRVWRDNRDLGELPFRTWKSITGRVHSIQQLIAEAEEVSREGWTLSADRVYRQISDILGVIVRALEEVSH